jgi:hypothetical protein
VLAAHLYGPRGQRIPKRGAVQHETYNSLSDRWDAFSNAMVELELAFPFSNQTSLPLAPGSGSVALANIFGIASTLYFCIPDNPELSALRDTIDDRLFKIRHCQNIEGVFRQLPLFEPPIDPALLVRAAAQGLSLSSVLNDLNSPIPNYRFYYLLQKSLEVCAELKSLGNAFLSAKEKGDGESLQRLRAKHESSIHNLVMAVRKHQVEEAEKALESLKQSAKGPTDRMMYYLLLLGEDVKAVPDNDRDFNPIVNAIEKPTDEGSMSLTPFEKEEMDKAAESAAMQLAIGGLETYASVLHALPNIEAYAAPLGAGASIKYGPENLAALLRRWLVVCKSCLGTSHFNPLTHPGNLVSSDNGRNA